MNSNQADDEKRRNVIWTKTDLVVDNVRKANLRVSQTILYISLCALVAFWFNELGIFYANKSIMRYFLFPGAVSLFLPYPLIRHSYELSVKPSTKYVLILLTILNTAIIGVVLFNYVQPLFILPAIVGVHYRSRKVRRLSIWGSVATAFLCPGIALLVGTWDSTFLSYLLLESLDGVYSGGGTRFVGEMILNNLAVAPEIAERIFANAPHDLYYYMHTGTIGKLLSAELFVGLPNAGLIFGFSMILSAASKTSRENMDERFEATRAIQDNAIASIGDIIENRDFNTGGHVKRTSDVVLILTQAMRRDGFDGRSDSFYDAVVKAAPMHDLGKIAIDDSILKKPGRLTPEEFDEIKTHSVKSEQIIDQVFGGFEDEEFMKIAKNLARNHHEKYDGNGYPDGLSGDDIPLEARIMTIADVYDALVSKRCYKAAVPFEKAYEIIESSMGSQFDPKLNYYFIACRDKIEDYYKDVIEREAVEAEEESGSDITA